MFDQICNEDNNINPEILQLDSIDIEMEIRTFDDEKQYKKFVSSCKKVLRNSYEYSEWVRYIKYSLGYDYCAFTREVSSEVTIDLHHHPISVENLVRIVIDKQLASYGKTTTFDVAKEVLTLHYENNVGYVLLVKTLHEKFHNGFLKIPIELVRGNWKYVIDNYYIVPEIMEVISKYANIRLQDVADQNGKVYTWSRDNYILVPVGG